MKKQCYKFQLFKLPYAYDALEPYIDTKTMKLHHDRHLKTYTDKLNAALAQCPELHSWSLERLLCSGNNIPMKIRNDVRNNGGGVYNHIYYFMGMSPDAEHVPGGELLDKICRTFGSWDEFKKKFKTCALDVFGSGYLWLVTDRRGCLKIVQTANQDSPISKGFCPIIVIDVWEHAYYLKHYNDRASYIDDWFAVLNAEFAEDNYIAGLC
ncbi:MAG: superoxide dismutase [Oscillospiraceae bacterium]|nr:superoxide dismutase [Oscillospiraceae bacterium]